MTISAHACYERFHTKEERKADEPREKGRASKRYWIMQGCSISKFAFVEEQAML